jgi:hypothetical protein
VLKAAVALAALLLAASACASSATGATPSPSPSLVASSPSPTPVQSPALTFKLNGVNSPASGTITLTTGPGTLTVRLVITGLAAASSHVSHIHAGSCTANGGVVFALNQVVADGQGNADVTTRLDATYPPASGTYYIVVHVGPDLQGPNASYLLCGNLFR